MVYNRTATKCFDHTAEEGYSTATLSKYFVEPKQYFKNITDKNLKWPYGCWFFIAKGIEISNLTYSVIHFTNVIPIIFVGSGVYVNIGKSLVVQNNRELVRRVFNIDYVGDKVWCYEAIKRGYNSIIILDIDFHRAQTLVLCSGGCLTKPLKESCPPSDIELRTGINATKLCNCSNAQNILNCGSFITPKEPCDSYTDPIYDDRGNHYQGKTCKLLSVEPQPDSFNFSLLFTDINNNSTESNLSLSDNLQDKYTMPHFLIINRGFHAIGDPNVFNFQHNFIESARSNISTCHSSLWKLYGSNVHIGIVYYYSNETYYEGSAHSYEAKSLSHIVRCIIEESICLRTAAPVIVLMLSSSSRPSSLRDYKAFYKSAKMIISKTNKYIDLWIADSDYPACNSTFIRHIRSHYRHRYGMNFSDSEQLSKIVCLNGRSSSVHSKLITSSLFSNNQFVNIIVNRTIIKSVFSAEMQLSYI
jgi:hypothetical protein